MTGTTPSGEHHSRLIRELCALLFTIVVSPSSPSPSPSYSAPGQRQRGRPAGMSPAAAASMLLGASVALMLCGSLTFAIGLLLMPWVAGLALLFGFAGAVSTLSAGVFGATNGNGKPSAAAAIPLPCSCKDAAALVP
ncbi:hypothetical protein U9M48_016669 [Paspalum notatum var. saurae]|uniref:Uncharacterized protein n=1 Tax=Paspalum notatum var. saurae TaxID=547442 RepID=A0AAQ3WMT3_PASNO